jgi:large subunit ribosomal protein L22
MSDIVTAKSNFIKGSTKKITLVLDTIKKKNVEQALSTLMQIKNKAALDTKKVLINALSNASNKGFVNTELFIKKAVVGQNKKVVRFHPRGRGKMSKIEKKYSNIYIELGLLGK